MATYKVKCSDGLWSARAYLGRDLNGKAIRPYKQFPMATSEAEATAMADAWFNHLTKDGTVQSACLVESLAEYIEIQESNTKSANSARSYRLYTKYVRKFLGMKSAAELTAYDFVKFQHKLQQPKSKGGQGLGNNTVRCVYYFLRGAYKWFVTVGIADTNPLLSVAKPKHENHEAQALNIGDFDALDAALKPLLKPEVLNKRTWRKVLNAMAAWIALVTGMRVGEICALRPNDIYRTQSPYIHVGGNVIEKKGLKPYRRDVTKGCKCRNVSITKDDLATIDAFLALRERFCGKLSANAPLLTVDGGFLRPTSVSRAFTNLAISTAAAPEGFTFHDLRHTHATWLLTHGVDLKTVSARLGHADAAVTARIYMHVMPGLDEAAAQAFAQAAYEATKHRKEVCQQ